MNTQVAFVGLPGMFAVSSIIEGIGRGDIGEAMLGFTYLPFVDGVG